jgi:hypothetical protein
MASTNEDVTALATARLDDGRLLALRLLPDRGTIEIGWWTRDETGIAAQPPTLEIAAEAPELSALVGLCEQVRATEWRVMGDGNSIATASLADGAELVAIRSGEQVTLVRRPERDDLIVVSPAALDLLTVDLLPAATAKLAALGFGMVQQEA